MRMHKYEVPSLLASLPLLLPCFTITPSSDATSPLLFFTVSPYRTAVSSLPHHCLQSPPPTNPLSLSFSPSSNTQPLCFPSPPPIPEPTALAPPRRRPPSPSRQPPPPRQQP
ncbi:uncharacterized protein DS421_18g622490 [Arachis hypogaea]|nr:uncharacterized protein DS421_18g622490 [Arachis hypogaea]